MGEAITSERALRLFGVYLNNVNLSGVDDSFVEWAIQNPRESGEQMSIFLRNRGRVVIGELKVVPIDRSKPFDPVKFKGLGESWTIWCGPANEDGLKGEEEQDSHSLALTEIDLTKIRFETCLMGTEEKLKGEAKLDRLKKLGHIRLDAKVFQTLWENQHLIPSSWKEKMNGNTTYIFFDGTVLRDPNGGRYVLSMYWFDGRWRWRAYWLGHDWDSSDLSAALPSEN
jgi:hypothetical protein